MTPDKKARDAGFFYAHRARLLEFDFLVGNVLARHRVKLAELQLVGRCLLVLRRRVEVSRTRRGLELDFFASALCHDAVS